MNNSGFFDCELCNGTGNNYIYAKSSDETYCICYTRYKKCMLNSKCSKKLVGHGICPLCQGSGKISWLKEIFE